MKLNIGMEMDET